VTPVVSGKPVALVRTAALGVPNAGVVKDGLLERTTLPVPVEVVVPVPPLATAIVVPVQVPEVIVPTEVKEELTTVLFKVVPERVPAGAITAAVEIAVTRPLPLTVTTGIAVELPKVPTLLLTVASVVTFDDPVLVTSPVIAAFVVTVPAVNPEAVPVILVPTRAEGVPNAGVTSVGEVARTTAPLPVVLAAEIAVPLPCKMPVIVVERVIAGVVVEVATVPANPFAETTETEVTVPFVAGEAHAGTPETTVNT